MHFVKNSGTCMNKKTRLIFYISRITDSYAIITQNQCVKNSDTARLKCTISKNYGQGRLVDVWA